MNWRIFRVALVRFRNLRLSSMTNINASAYRWRPTTAYKWQK